eukprot:Nitzschia sp. Nitz4//scaffold3_size479765//423506//424569//NITZ4_000179-RA/size479765-augustus-gene-1.584-mRNA-1//1//CDS//3329550995//4187//frame0
MMTEAIHRGKPHSGGIQLSRASSDDSHEKGAKIHHSYKQQFNVVFAVLALFFIVSVSYLYGRGGTAGTTPHVRNPVATLELGPTEEQLQQRVNDLDAKVREHKAKPKMIMEKDPQGLILTKQLQQETHRLLVKRYGRHTFRVQVDLVFPEVITAKDGLPAEDHLTIELAPIDLIPCSVYNFLEIARTWKSGAFHRNANHVLQVAAHSAVRKHMPFQEYSPEFPHRKGTTGYAGRPSGPAWYVSIMDNTVNHGPGSQQAANPYEADSLFGSIVQGMEDVVPRIHSTPQMSWLDKENQIAIPRMTILIPDPQNPKAWIPWKESAANGVATMRR